MSQYKNYTHCMPRRVVMKKFNCRLERQCSILHSNCAASPGTGVNPWCQKCQEAYPSGSVTRLCSQPRKAVSIPSAMAVFLTGEIRRRPYVKILVHVTGLQLGSTYPDPFTTVCLVETLSGTNLHGGIGPQ